MNVIRQVYHVMRADFLERVRHYSFLLVMGVTVYAGYMMVPTADAPYSAFVIAGHRGFYNSPWVGMIFGVVASTLLSLFGFYLVKDAVNRDYSTRVGQILATTTVSKPVYILGKWLSNLAVLTVILLALSMTALLMQLVRAEKGSIDLGALVVPILYMGFPTMAIVAAMAVLFESIPFLRRGTGHVVYFITWGIMLGATVGRMFVSIGNIEPHNDLAGLSRMMVNIRQQLSVNGVDLRRGATDLGVPTKGRQVARFLWEGMDWSAKIFFERSLWLGLAVALALTATIPFDRFDPARWRTRRQWKRKRSDQAPILLPELSGTLGLPMLAVQEAAQSIHSQVVLRLTPIEESTTHRRFCAIVLAELRLIVRGQNRWWLLVASGFVVASLFCPLNVVRHYLLPAAWLWPILSWSALGNRELRHHTGQIVFSTSNVFRCQLLATWFAGFLTAILTGCGTGARLVLAGLWDHFLTWAIGAAFIPSLALALGVWSRNSRLFEMIYVLWWYLGSIGGVAVLDYMNIKSRAVTDDISIMYVVASILLFGVAVVGRHRQLRHD